MQSYRQSMPAGSFKVKSTQGDRSGRRRTDYNSEDGIDSGGEPAFETQNYLFELQSKCNNLEYEKTKLAMHHDTIVSELRFKNEHLQQLNSSLSQQNHSLSQERDMLRTLLADLREQNFIFSKEISQMRLEMSNLLNRSLAGQNMKQDEQAEAVREQLRAKDELIQSLEEQLQQTLSFCKENENACKEMEKNGNRLKQEMENIFRTAEVSRRDCEELKLQIKAKESEFKEERIKLMAQVSYLKEQRELKVQQKKTAELQQLKRLSDAIKVKEQKLLIAENDHLALQSRMSELNLELGRLKCQKTNLQQLNEYLQSTSLQNQGKRRQLQQQIFKNESEMADLRGQLFSQKLESKKQLNNLRMQFEEERMRLIQSLDEKSKQISKLRQEGGNTNRYALDIEELSMRTQGVLTDLDKANNQISLLRMENSNLRGQLKALETKLQKKQEKYCSLQSKLKMQNGQRLKSLQAEIYRLQENNSELQEKLNSQERKLLVQEGKQQSNNKELIELLKLQGKQKEQYIKSLEQKIRELELAKREKEERISKLEEDISLGREFKFAGSDQKANVIELLKEQLQALNKQVIEQRMANQKRRRESWAAEEKMQQQLRGLETEKQNSLRQILQLKNTIYRFEEEGKKKEEQLDRLKKQLQLLKLRKQVEKEQRALKRKEEEDKEKAVRPVSELIKAQKEKIDITQQKRSLMSSEFQRIVQLERENAQLKLNYANSCQQMSSLLVRYKKIEEKNCLLTEQQKEQAALKGNGQALRTRISQLQQECERLRQIIIQQEVEEKNLIKIINELKQQASLSYSHLPNKSTRMSERLWLDKDYKVAERDINEIKANYRYPCRHHI